MDIKRRGFMTGLGAFFGLGAAESISGDVADAQLDGTVDEKPKPAAAVAPGSQVVSCRPGDIIELQLGNIRTRARVEQYEIECIPQGIDISDARGYKFLERPPRITIALRLRSVSDPMVMDVTVD